MANPIIERAKAHFDSIGRKRIEVPEWGEGGKPLVIYSRAFTLADKKKIRAHTERGGSSDIDALAYTIIFKAEDDQGKPLFTLEDKQSLISGVDSEVLSRIVLDMTMTASPEDMEKKS